MRLRGGGRYYCAALEERTRERVPLQWAATDMGLECAQSTGRAESGTARLEQAVAAYRAALEEYTRDRVPLYGGHADQSRRRAIGARERRGGTARLWGSGRGLSRGAEGMHARARPLQWADTQDSLGRALTRLGEREQGTARLEEAVATYRAALEERTREKVPLQWAGSHEEAQPELQ